MRSFPVEEVLGKSFLVKFSLRFWWLPTTMAPGTKALGKVFLETKVPREVSPGTMVPIQAFAVESRMVEEEFCVEGSFEAKFSCPLTQVETLA